MYTIRSMSTGLQVDGWFQKEINSVDNVKGLRFRIPRMGGKVMKCLGGDVLFVWWVLYVVESFFFCFVKVAFQ